MNNLEFKVVKYKKGTFEPETIKRVSDGVNFSIGDRVTNGTKMQGKITKFSYGDIVNVPIKEQEVYVLTDWSGIGMNLSSLSHVRKEDKEQIELPSRIQVTQMVYFIIPRENQETYKIHATVRAVHFYESKVKYDLELFLPKGSTTKIYNIDSLYVEEI